MHPGVSGKRAREVDRWIAAPERWLEDALFDDEALAYFLVTRAWSCHPVPASQRELFDRLEARLATDEVFLRRAERLQRRLAELLGATDLAGSFEKLTGYPLGGFAAASNGGDG